MLLFITFEGGEGSGKSTQARMLFRRVARLGRPVILTHEPGGTPFGEKIARLLKWSAAPLTPSAELLLFNASRAQLVQQVIAPALQAGHVVICDRFINSTIAYQGYGRGQDLAAIAAVNSLATGGLRPDLTILLDLPVHAALERTKERRPDRFEQENISFHRRVRDGYLKMAADEPERWVVIDAAQSKQEIAGQIWEKISRFI